MEKDKDIDIDGLDHGVIFRRSWAWAGLVLPPLVMLVIPAEIVAYIIEPEWPLRVFTFSLTEESDVFARHINYRIVYATMILFHVALCLCLILLFWDRLRDFPRFLRHRAYVFMTIEASLFLAILRFYWRDTTLYKLSYTNIRDLLAKTGVLNDIVPIGVNLDKVTTKLSIFVYIPQIFSVAALIVALAVAGSVVGNLREAPESEWRERFIAGVNSLQICFFGLSAALVTSTFTASLFFQFPANLAAADEQMLKTAVTALSEYAYALTVFWGAVYSLTLVATFAPAAIVLRSEIRRHGQRSESPDEFSQWLAEKALVSPSKWFRNIVVMLAPLLFSAVGSLLKLLPSGG